jgi:hypothetical protein
MRRGYEQVASGSSCLDLHGLARAYTPGLVKLETR